MKRTAGRNWAICYLASASSCGENVLQLIEHELEQEAHLILLLSENSFGFRVATFCFPVDTGAGLQNI
ncbi:hypothetical protein Mapa_004638 [Marchantia paleacea]|nr:hypothetical protein Mapa_004638 [Marchantia paleacea]